MRSIASAGLLAALVTLPASALSATNQQPNPNGTLQTPDRAGTANVGAAATAPLHDLNITRQGVPPVLLAAITNPYDLPHPLNCGEIIRQIHELDIVLGVDLDVPGTPQAPSLTLRNGKIVLALIHGAADWLLPYAGFVRTLSGSQRHDQLIIEAITAGSVRRGYLKGLGESRRCPRPARPVHFVKPPPPAREGGRGPVFPIK
jgi:hypothetical protein